ncbi:MAG: SDR family oxidoreductase [Desulfobacteraceae bacterium]|nr:SDR family oxidoreductase [Desulfobacteraceae bacterium]
MHFQNEFQGRSVIVTGSAGGIGKETALHFAREGAKIAICDVKIEAGEETAEQINKSGGNAFFAEMDVSDPAAVDRVVEQTLAKFGGIDVLVNSAGISGSGFRNLSKVADAEWDRTYQVNLRGTAHCCRSVFGVFRKQQHGKIINVSSVAGRMPAPGMTPYAASKAGVISLTQSLAAEMGRYNVNVNALCPGWVWTPIYSQNQELQAYAEKVGSTPRAVFQGMVESLCPLKREQTEADMANVILFLASEAAKNITGQAIHVDGGAVMR